MAPAVVCAAVTSCTFLTGRGVLTTLSQTNSIVLGLLLLQLLLLLPRLSASYWDARLVAARQWHRKTLPDSPLSGCGESDQCIRVEDECIRVVDTAWRLERREPHRPAHSGEAARLASNVRRPVPSDPNKARPTPNEPNADNAGSPPPTNDSLCTMGQ